MTRTFQEEVTRAATRVALCNRLDEILEQVAIARKQIEKFDGEFDDQTELMPNPKPRMVL